MDYSEQRQKYLEHYTEYLERLILTNELKICVKEYSPALWKTIEVLQTFLYFLNIAFTKNNFIFEIEGYFNISTF